jgi:hypothetical protein
MMQGKADLILDCEERKSWVPMKVVLIGKATEMIRGGGGKLSLSGGDPGEGKKQSGGMG